MDHFCEFPVSENEACGEIAHHFLDSDGIEFNWLCSHHFDLIALMLKALAIDWSDPDARHRIVEIVRKNRM